MVVDGHDCFFDHETAFLFLSITRFFIILFFFLGGGS